MCGNPASNRTTPQGPHEFRADFPATAGIHFESKEQVVKALRILIATTLFIGTVLVQAQQTDSTVPRTINLHEAVEMALKRNHGVRIAALHVEEEQHAKEVARSAYLPNIWNASTFGHATDTQFIVIPTGGLGIAGGSPIPARPLTINQGDINYILSGTEVTQPLTQLFKIKAGNDVARADLNASREKARRV